MDETIVAVSTPPGEGGIGVVRLSGPNSISIAQSIFLSKHPLGTRIRFAEYGNILVKEQAIDTGLACVFVAPNSYTGEDTVEISCHGSRLILEMVVNEAIRLGARSAAPGEFTRRAYMNGRLDLIQAEAVVDLIQASSEKGVTEAYNLAGGRLSQEILQLKESLVKVLAYIEVGLDFSDEDIDPISRQQIAQQLDDTLKQAQQLVDTFEVGRRRMQGYMVALVGQPNVGKSTLLNNLLGEERAIVTDIPGTTRDLVEGRTVWGGHSIRLIDTAGIRESTDPIEFEGIKRARKMAEEADLTLFVIDATQLNFDSEINFLRKLDPEKTIVVLNKIDQCKHPEKSVFCNIPVVVEISALTGFGRADLIDTALSILPHSASSEGVVLTRQRHVECLNSMIINARNALKLLQAGEPDECIAVELQEAHRHLGALLGEDVGEDLLDSIFSDFCIGK